MASNVDLQSILARSAARHNHLCPRQVLGARAGLAGAGWLQLDTPRTDKRLLVIVETDGCFVDGIESATQVSVGRRTLRVEDYGKIAATFIDTLTGKAVRLAPQMDARQTAWLYAPGETESYQAQLAGYQEIPLERLFSYQKVHLTTPLEAIISQPGLRTSCEICGEDIINQREVHRAGKILCRACSGPAYYRLSME